MDRSDYTDADYRQPHVPPTTPPVIDSNASAGDAATLALADGDSDAPGSQPAHFNRGREDETLFDHGNAGHLQSGGGDRDFPGEQPDEIVPGQGDDDWPERTPDEVAPGQGDFDRPDSAPQELPPQPDTAPVETPPAD
ncbi:MAG TPA: hypothetical protein VEB68_11685 [Croceibacterium sp.]|nr:hypothetical protein [Solirubrobacterales bacterium]HYD25447.1 hypothetical protein [Croceibacterium sp.]